MGLAAILATLACGGDTTGPGVPDQAEIVLELTLARNPDAATEGTLEAWLVDGAGTRHSAGRFVPDATGRAVVQVPVPGAVVLEITLEPPGDQNTTPSPQLLLKGAFSGGRADLGVAGALTQGSLPLRTVPGQFTMFSPSDNQMHGYPSFEESGIWLFNMAPRDTPQNDMWVRLAQLAAGWTYEGWMVRDYGTPGAVWLSYGKFTPDQSGAVNRRDDTGWGPFSGVTDFRTAGEEEFPGDDWISNPLNYPVPGGLSLPIDLRERGAGNAPRWTHIISIEPAFDRGEPITAERPFLILPYRDPFSALEPGDAIPITFHPGAVPVGKATVR